MTAQDHINEIGAAMVALEKTTGELAQAARRVEKLATKAERQARRVHFLQDRAQRAFKEAYPADNIVLFSGGTNKPPVDDPDGPVKP
jgi:hypothetical protein